MSSTTVTRAQKWLDSYIPQAAEPVKTVFFRWLDRLGTYFQARNVEISDNSPLWPYHTLRYFYPSLTLLNSPFAVPGMPEAVELFRRAYAEKQQTKLVLYADRDADGISAASILYLFLLEKMGFPRENLKVLLPREEDKYGITPEVGERIIAEAPDILITIDCGSSNKDSIGLIKNRMPASLPVIVLDHHFLPELEEDRPDVEAFVNPKRLPSSHSMHELCSSGLAYHLIYALTYSYTSEYDKVYLIDPQTQEILYKNGVEISDTALSPSREEVQQIAFETDDGEYGVLSGRDLWLREKTRHKELYEIDQFLNEHPEAISSSERLWALQKVLLSRVGEKVKAYLPLAAIGTVADLVPLIGDNRVLVAQGLNLIKQGRPLPLGLHQLLSGLGVLQQASESDLAFTVCPTVNAAGRLGSAELAFNTLTAQDPVEAAQKAFELKQLNETRKNLSKEALDYINEDLETADVDSAVAIAYHSKVHRGISGLVASRLAEQYKKPALVLVEDGECLRGSLRAFQDEDVYSVLHAVGHLTLQYGGHRQAAGFSLAREDRALFCQEFQRLANQASWQSTEKSSDEILQEFGAPIEVSEKELKPDLWRKFLHFAPYGMLNPHPRVLVKAEQPVSVKRIGVSQDHARIDFMGAANSDIEGIWFFHRGAVKDSYEGPTFWEAEPHLNCFQGRVRYQLKIKKVDTA